MNKSDLIEELKDTTKSSYEVLIKGYLNHFDMDQNVWVVLLDKLKVEATQIWDLCESPVVNEELYENVMTKLKNLQTVVSSACEDELREEPYVSESINILLQKFNPEFKKKLNHYLQDGYSVLTDNPDGAIEIINFMSETVYKEPEMTCSVILKEWGIDTENELYPLFFFSFVQKDFSSYYKTCYCLSKFFKF